MNQYKEIKDFIQQLIQAKNRLKELGVIRSERFTGEFGEWFAEKLVSGQRAPSTSQTGWDLISDGKKYQVKTHAKSHSNNARWTDWKYEEKKFDDLILLIFTSELYLREAYIIPFDIIEQRVNRSNKQVVLKWDDYSDYKIFSFPIELKLFVFDSTDSYQFH